MTQSSLLCTMSHCSRRLKKNEAKLRRQLTGALMRAIDQHDPYSANHSAQTAKISVAVGKAMHLDSQMLKTLEIAANLCNLGKLSISKDILTKEERLTDEELLLIRQETQHAWDLLQDIDFQGKVKETIIQKHEYLDGSGHPHGIAGEEIIPSARILAAANAFVAMISPRAYRDKLSTRAALEQLNKDVDSKYDRKVIAALYHVVENELEDL